MTWFPRPNLAEPATIFGKQEEDEEDWFQPRWTCRNLFDATNQLIMISGEQEEDEEDWFLKWVFSYLGLERETKRV